MVNLKQALEDAKQIALESNAHVRVFDIRYAVQGLPDEITQDWVRFPAGSFEVLETGDLNGPPKNCDVLRFPRWIANSAIIQFEVAVPA